MEWFCKGMVGGGQYTGGGQEQPEQERPEQRVAPKPTNRTMFHHHHHPAFPVSWFERDCDNPTVNSKQQQLDDDNDARHWCLTASSRSI